MSLAGTAERDELRTTIRRFVDSRGGLALGRDATDGRHHAGADLWRRFATELSLQGLAVDDRHGGSGGGYQELGLAFEELGRALVPEPFVATLGFALPILEQSNTADDLLAELSAGERTFAVAWSEDQRPWDRAPHATKAAQAGETWTITGSKRFVLGGDVATTALVTVSADNGTAIVAVDLDQTCVHRTAHRGLDGTHGFADIDFDNAPARLVIAPDRGDGVLSRALDVGAVMLANEAIGAAAACLDMTVEYARTRQQFDRPIGSFQAVKHKLADCYVALEGATSTAHYAAWSADHDADELALLAPVAKYTATEACYRIAADAIQIHGGIGFTWEHDAHLYFKYAKTSLMYGGSSDETLADLADRLRL